MPRLSKRSASDLAEMRACGDEGDPSERSVVQFATRMMYIGESGVQWPIVVMRIGCLETSCSVTYCTEADEFEGIKYEAIHKTKLEFAPGESFKTIHLQLRENASYDNVIEAQLFLDDPERCTLGMELHRMRVKIIDDDVFPDNKFKEQLEKDHTTDSWRSGQDFAMVMAFAKMAFLATMPGSLKAVLADQITNLIYISTLAINKALITTLAASVSEEISRGWQVLLAYALCLTLPFLIEHYLSYRRQFWQIGGGARKLLLHGLMEKYMYYQESTRDLIDLSEFKLTFSEDAFHLVDKGFMQLFALVADISRIVMVCLFVVVLACLEYANSGDTFIFFALVPMLAVPPVMVFYVRMRWKRAEDVREDVLDAKLSLLDFMNTSVEHICMITSFLARPLVMAQCNDRIEVLNQHLVIDGSRNANDMAFFSYVDKVLQFLIVFFGGLSVVYSGVDLGTFTAALSAFMGSSALYRKVYTCLKVIESSYPCCWHVVEYMNNPTDLPHRQVLGHRVMEEFQARLRDLAARACPGQGQPVDMVDITVENVKFCYSGASSPIDWGTQGMSMRIGQGQLVAITGAPVFGSKTLTRLLAGELLPTEGHVFVPPHLRVLRVAIRPVLWDGPLAMNLFWGLMPQQGYTGLMRLEGYRKLPDGEIQRGLQICRRLDVPEHLIQKIQDDVCGSPGDAAADASEAKQNSELLLASIPASARCKIQLACALICDPAVLVLDRPFQSLTVADASRVMECLREYVDRKGLERDEAHLRGRRPRTCILTSNSSMLLAGADEVFNVGEDHTIQVTSNTENLLGEAGKMIQNEEEHVVRCKSLSRQKSATLMPRSNSRAEIVLLDSPRPEPESGTPCDDAPTLDDSPTI